MEAALEFAREFAAEVLAGDTKAIAATAAAGVATTYVVSKLVDAARGRNLPPTVSGWLPFIGVGLQFGIDPVKLMMDAYNRHGDCVAFKLFGERLILLAGPEASSLFFKATEEQFSANAAYRFTVPVFGPGVVYDVDPHVLVEQRGFVRAGLTLKQFKNYVDKIVLECEGFLSQKWGTSGKDNNIEMMSDFSELTVLTSVSCLQGPEIRKNVSAEFAALYWELDASLSPIAFFFPNLPLAASRQSAKTRAKMGQLFKGVIDNRRKNNEHHEDMLQIFMESKYKDGSTLGTEQIAGLCVALLLAGQHTSNVTSTWLGIFLGLNPEIRKRCIDEQREIFSDGDDTLTYEKLRKMTVLENVMKETLRMRPPIMMIARRVLQDVKYRDYVLPAGSLVACSPTINHRLPTCWENPDKFDPDRFDRNEDKKQPFQYIAFGAGAHGCIGEGFAYVQVKSIWSYILRHYDFELVGGKMPVTDWTTMIAGPKPPVTFRVRRLVPK